MSYSEEKVELGGRKGGIASLNQFCVHQHTISFSHYSSEYTRVTLRFPEREALCAEEESEGLGDSEAVMECL